jgi:hypothetical protein
LNGPATEPQPCFVARERAGQIELRAQSADEAAATSAR